MTTLNVTNVNKQLPLYRPIRYDAVCWMCVLVNLQTSHNCSLFSSVFGLAQQTHTKVHINF